MAGSVSTCILAPAKINLLLRVGERRPDGFHDLHTLFQSLALHDTVTVRVVRGPFQLECTDPKCPADRDNLVWRAAERVWRAAGRAGAPENIAIHLAKRIPMQAGLGGGSSDAAAALRVLGARWRVGKSRLLHIAAALGSDVPYFLEGGTVLGIGRGDRLFPLDDLPAFWVTIVVPDFGVSTRNAYEWLDQARRHPVLDTCEHHGASGSRRQGGAQRQSGNNLEAPVVTRHPEIGRLIRALDRAGAVDAAMSGSGSAVYGLFPQRAAAERAARILAGRARKTVVTRTVGRAAYQRLTRMKSRGPGA